MVSMLTQSIKLLLSTHMNLKVFPNVVEVAHFGTYVRGDARLCPMYSSVILC
jgi:hypothetical protein